MSVDLMALTWVPLVLFAIYELQPAGKIMAVAFVITALGTLIQQTVTVIRRADKRQKYREALAGELATAQLLDPVVAYGGRVLHDIQAPRFNIDRVVVAPGGVFAVETKYRLKSTKGKAMEQANVRFGGQALQGSARDTCDFLSLQDAVELGVGVQNVQKVPVTVAMGAKFGWI